MGCFRLKIVGVFIVFSSLFGPDQETLSNESDDLELIFDAHEIIEKCTNLKKDIIEVLKEKAKQVNQGAQQSFLQTIFFYVPNDNNPYSFMLKKFEELDPELLEFFFNFGNKTEVFEIIVNFFEAPVFMILSQDSNVLQMMLNYFSQDFLPIFKLINETGYFTANEIFTKLDQIYRFIQSVVADVVYDHQVGLLKSLIKKSIKLIDFALCNQPTRSSCKAQLFHKRREFIKIQMALINDTFTPIFAFGNPSTDQED